MLACPAYPIPSLPTWPGRRAPQRGGHLTSLPGGRAPTLMAAAGAPKLPSLLRIRLGDPAARQEYLQYFWPRLEQEVRRYHHLGAPVDDLQGEAALALWEAAHQYDPRQHRTTVEQYVQNHVHRRVRQAYRKAVGYDQAKVVPLERIAGLPAIDTRVDQVTERLDLERARQALPTAEQHLLRRYLALVVGEGVGPDQAAHRLAHEEGGSPAAFKKRLQRTRQKLREQLRP